MSFASQLNGMRVIDASNSDELAKVVVEDARMSGYIPRDYEEHPFGSVSGAYEGPNIPRSEWADRVEELEAKEATLEHLLTFRKMPILNQSRRPYCWCYGFTGAKMASYAAAGEEIPHLSATSLAAKIKNYRDVGGWAGEAIEGDKKFGTSTIEFWPEAALDRRYDTPEQRENAKLHIVHEYLELQQQSFDAVFTQLLLGFPVTLGLMWWGHLVFATRPIVLGRNRFAVGIRNSWGYDWEKDGQGVLAEERATPHEAYSVRTARRLAA